MRDSLSKLDSARKPHAMNAAVPASPIYAVSRVKATPGAPFKKAKRAPRQGAKEGAKVEARKMLVFGSDDKKFTARELRAMRRDMRIGTPYKMMGAA